MLIVNSSAEKALRPSPLSVKNGPRREAEIAEKKGRPCSAGLTAADFCGE